MVNRSEGYCRRAFANVVSDTVKGRGYDAETCVKILRENGWNV